mgnify:CR=1 FL=1
MDVIFRIILEYRGRVLRKLHEVIHILLIYMQRQGKGLSLNNIASFKVLTETFLHQASGLLITVWYTGKVSPQGNIVGQGIIYEVKFQILIIDSVDNPLECFKSEVTLPLFELV